MGGFICLIFKFTLSEAREGKDRSRTNDLLPLNHEVCVGVTVYSSDGSYPLITYRMCICNKTLAFCYLTPKCRSSSRRIRRHCVCGTQIQPQTSKRLSPDSQLDFPPGAVGKLASSHISAVNQALPKQLSLHVQPTETNSCVYYSREQKPSSWGCS